MNLNQDLIEWLRTTNADEKNNFDTSDGTGLLLAPMSVSQPDSETEPPLPDLSVNSVELLPNEHETDNLTDETVQELYEIKNTLQTIQETIEDSNNEIEEEPKPEVKNLSEWHETASKFDLSLDEPPIELWTQISESIQDDDYYEQSMSLQGDAYIQLPTEHGKNFTQRLQHTLKTRQQKAEILREEKEKERKKNPPYVFKALIICSCLVIEIAFLCFLLFALNRYSLIRKLENEEPQLIQQEQEQKIETQEENETEKQEIEIILPKLEPTKNNEGDVATEIQNEITKSEDAVIEPETKVEEVEKNPLTFEELLTEANNAYNFGNHDTAALIFHRAIESNSDDIRPYIGLARAYGAKKLYFDAKRILDRARKKFGKDPTIETELKFLLRESKLNHERKRYKGK